MSIRRDLFPADERQRKLALVFFVNCLGNGMYLPAALLFLTKVGHWSAPRVGLAFTVAGVVAVLTSVVFGHAADRRGPRELAAALFVCEGVAIAGLCSLYWSRSYALLLLMASAGAGASVGGRAVWGVLISRVGGEDRVPLRARLRALSNLGIALGAAVAGLGIELDSTFSYVALVLTDAGSFLLAAALLFRLPHFGPVPRPAGGPRLPVLRDLRFVAVCCSNIVLTWQYGVLLIALPLWIVHDTAAPRWMAGGMLLLNTVLVAAFQVRASRGVAGLKGAVGSLRRAGAMFLAACAGFALAGQVPAVVAVLLLAAAAAVHTVGELWHAAAAFEIPYASAPEHAVGGYQGVFEMAHGISTASAPAVVTLLCIAWGATGWLVLGGLLAASGLVTGWILERSTRAGSPIVLDEVGG